MALSGNLDAEHRREALAEMAAEDGGVELDVAARRFGVSAMTIRRDLIDLEDLGRVRRVRGGAVSVERAAPFDSRRALRGAAKRTIAQKAAALTPTRGIVAFDASTTISMLASTMTRRAGLLVCTNSVETFVALRGVDGLTPHLTGGEPEPTTGSLIGASARGVAESLYFDVFFASADSLDPADGTSEVSVDEAAVKRSFAKNAQRTILCVDATKLGRRSVARALAWGDVDTLVTELDAGDARLDPYRDQVSIV